MSQASFYNGQTYQIRANSDGKLLAQRIVLANGSKSKTVFNYSNQDTIGYSSEKSIEDYNQYYEIDAEDGSYKKGDAIKDLEGNVIVYKGVKSVLKANEKSFAGSLLSKYDWYVTRKSEKGTAIPTEITTYRDAIRTACDTRETEITNCADTAALVTLYGNTEKDGVITPNMTQYPTDPNDK